MDILFIEMHILYRGMSAWTYIEYMKIIVEKMSRIVIKQLLIIFIIEDICEKLRLLKIM